MPRSNAWNVGLIRSRPTLSWDGKDHLPCRQSFPESIRHPGTRPTVRGRAEIKGSQCRAQKKNKRIPADRKIGIGHGTESASGLGGGLYRRPAQNGLLHRTQHTHLSNLSELYRPGGYPCVFYRRGVHGRNSLSAHLWSLGARIGKKDNRRCATADRYHGDSGNRHQPVPMQGGYGH